MREWPVLESVILRAGRGGRMMCADRVSGRRPGAAPGTAPVFVCARARANECEEEQASEEEGELARERERERSYLVLLRS